MPLINFQIKKLASIGITDLMISGYSRPIPGTRFIPDSDEGKGPLSGIHACLLNSSSPSCLVLSVDTPLIPGKLLLDLIKTFERDRNPVTIVSHQGIIEPLIGIYDCTVIPFSEQLLFSGKTSLFRLLDLVPYSVVHFTGDDSVFLNCNTPDDYLKLESLENWNCLLLQEHPNSRA